MKPPQFLLALLFGALAMGDLATLTFVVSTARAWPALTGVMLASLAFGQTMMLAAWFVLAGGNIAIRVLTAIAIVFGLSLVAAGAIDGSGVRLAPWFAIQFVAFCAATIPLAAARGFGWQFNLEAQPRPDGRMSARQFSIFGLLSVTTAVAVALGTAKYIDMPDVGWGSAVVFFGCLTGTGLLVFVPAMGIKAPELAALVCIPIVALICPFGGLLMCASGLPPRPDPPLWMFFGGGYGATIGVVAVVLRVAGYRLTRQVSTAVEELPGPRLATLAELRED